MNTDCNLLPTVDLEKTGKKIAYIMKINNVSVKQLREYMNLGSEQSIYKWLKGKNFPTLDNLYAISSIFSVPVDELLCGNKEEIEFIKRRNHRVSLYFFKLCDISR